MTIYPTPEFKAGDKVAYTVQFLRSIGMSHSDMTRARGTAVEVENLGTKTNPFTLVRVKWDHNADMPERVNAKNLAKVGPNARFCNVD